MIRDGCDKAGAQAPAFPMYIFRRLRARNIDISGPILFFKKGILAVISDRQRWFCGDGSSQF